MDTPYSKLGSEELTHLIEESIVRQIEDDVADWESNELASFRKACRSRGRNTSVARVFR